MKVLQLCHKPPFPEIDGGCLAMNQMTKALEASGMEVSILSIVTPKHPFIAEKFPEGYLDRTNFKAIFVDTNLKAVDAFVNLVSQDAYHVSRFFSPDVDMELCQLLQETTFDIIFCESIYVTPYIETIRKYTTAPIVLRSHNLEFSIWHRLTKGYKMGIKKTYLKILTKQLREYEVDCLNKIDGLIPINADELKHYHRLGYNGPALTVPFGINPEKYLPDHSNREVKTVFHLGSMDWKPNQEGVQWFLEKVWPLVSKENPELNLHLAGRNMPEWLTNYQGSQVVIDGEVENALDYIKSKNIMIVPLMSGGGMRVKMVEALALEKPVVSTPIGANGVHVEDGFSAIIASQPRAMAKAILRLAADQARADAMGKRGRELINDQYNTTKLSKELAVFLNNLES